MKRFLIASLVVAGFLATGASAQQLTGALARIKAAKAINVAYSADSLPFSFNGPNGEPAGYSIDLCRRAIAQIGRAVGEPNLKVNWIAGATPARLQMVASGKADLECANTTQTLSRLASVDFSGLTFVDASGFIVRKDTSIAQMSDLGGKKIAVLRGTTTETRLRAALQRKLVNATVVPIGEGAEGIAMLESGGADAYAGDKIKLVGLVAQAKDPAKFAMLAQRRGAAPRGEPRAHAGLSQRRDREDLRAVAGLARAPHGPARRDVPALFDSRVVSPRRPRARGSRQR
jgi:ABC-type amino acid transport substrate-binding protein